MQDRITSRNLPANMIRHHVNKVDWYSSAVPDNANVHEEVVHVALNSSFLDNSPRTVTFYVFFSSFLKSYFEI